jgi:hypothetical protein
MVLEEGHHWKIGDGSSINIWTDHWLSSMYIPCVQTPYPFFTLLQIVDNLIDNSTRSWIGT